MRNKKLRTLFDKSDPGKTGYILPALDVPKSLLEKHIDKKFLNYFRSFSKLMNNKPKTNIYSLLKDTNLKKYLTLINKKNLNLDINLNKSYSKYHKDIKNLFNFILKKPTIKEMAIFVKNLDHLFKGSCGLGINYFIFKNETTKIFS